MKAGKRHNKFLLVKRHRINQYLYEFNKLVDGKGDPELVAVRWNKFKAVSK